MMQRIEESEDGGGSSGDEGGMMLVGGDVTKGDFDFSNDDIATLGGKPGGGQVGLNRKKSPRQYSIRGAKKTEMSEVKRANLEEITTHNFFEKGGGSRSGAQLAAPL
jgi:hypothetical protein